MEEMLQRCPEGCRNFIRAQLSEAGKKNREKLDAEQTESAQASAFFKRNPVPATFSVPPSEEYLKELHAC
ncbi:unnamed protein product [Arctogadus glacialis]